MDSETAQKLADSDTRIDKLEGHNSAVGTYVMFKGRAVDSPYNVPFRDTSRTDVIVCARMMVTQKRGMTTELFVTTFCTLLREEQQVGCHWPAQSRLSS